MEKVDWKVEGMTCSNCALSIKKFLEKAGSEEIHVNAINGGVSFIKNTDTPLIKIEAGLNSLGYKVAAGNSNSEKSKQFLPDNKSLFLFTLPFTLVLMLHMLPAGMQLHWLMNPLIQVSLCLPVFITGMYFFGRSAVRSLRSGVPNMNVLIALGALAAFVYSLTGEILQLGEQYLFFETSASIITLVFLGNYLEEASVQSTQRAVKSLAKSQKVMANMIAFDHEHKEQIFAVEGDHLRSGDLILIRNGEQVPVDCKVLSGECMVNEAIITGESLPLLKKKKDFLIGGSVLENGIIKAQVTATGSQTVLSGILKMVQDAQSEKPPMQKLADKVSAVFVPAVIGIALLTFVINFSIFHIAGSASLMRSIAVLVISCPCAMGLATPAAIAVGLGRAAKRGILFRNAAALESFKTIRQVVFDKTGTLTTGTFVITRHEAYMDEEEFKKIAFSMHKFSNHPLAKAVSSSWKFTDSIKWKSINEVKGVGVVAEDMEGNLFESGSWKILPEGSNDIHHNIYILKNKKLAGWIDAKDEIRAEAAQVIKWLHQQKIKTILLSGDKQEKCETVAKELNIDEVFSEQSPQQKLDKIEALNKDLPTAMVGDGINDAPALAKATLGISLSEAAQIAIQSADVILMNNGFKHLPEALGLGRHTYLTIRQNLFWAFLYNVVALPVAAIGLLTPTLAALAMGLSDVVLAVNSVRLFVKKVV